MRYRLRHLRFWLWWTLWHTGATTWPERAQMWIAWRVPRWLAVWVVVRVFAAASSGRYGSSNVADIDFATALRRFEERSDA